MGRLHHLQKTLPRNLADNESTPRLEFVVLDYTSLDGLGTWIRSNFQNEIKSERLVYARLEGQTSFQIAYAKNVAHRLATGDILCNVDADNYIGPKFGEFLREKFSKSVNIFIHAPGTSGAGGRIALHAAHFHQLGGYDERFGSSWGYEDNDLLCRARGLGLRRVCIPPGSPFVKIIQHGDDERLSFVTDKRKHWTRRRNKLLSDESLAASQLVANRNILYGDATVYRNFTEWVRTGHFGNQSLYSLTY